MYDDLIKRLRSVEGADILRFRNPDGLEAANLIEDLLSRLPDCPDPVARRSDSFAEMMEEIFSLKAELAAWQMLCQHDILPDGSLVPDIEYAL